MTMLKAFLISLLFVVSTGKLKPCEDALCLLENLQGNAENRDFSECATTIFNLFMLLIEGNTPFTNFSHSIRT